MAAFIAKQMVGSQLNAVKGAVGGDGGDDENDKEKEEEAERERQEAIREAEERRKEKHRKMEEEREKMRQEIRDKYNIKKKEEVVEQAPQEEPNPLMRKKKTPEELAAEAEQEDLDDFTNGDPSSGNRTVPNNRSINYDTEIKQVMKQYQANT
ncbi:complexin isoform X3 [Aedes aegypti]|uniref:Uncharacterized protein n=1 Tax=Aedes aegypti TaxID=7159 RepID=A0A6I8TEC4_AEDAE|nr:complexin isoform X3 [Aedes aegypti]